MAARRTSKGPSRRKQASEPTGIAATVLPGDESENGATRFATGESENPLSAKNGGPPSFEQIQRRAYELFVARGGAPGLDWFDWFTAEQELTPTSTSGH